MRKVKLFLVGIFTPFILSAGIVNGVSIIVDDEPITMYEIYKMSKEAKVAYEDAIEKLIEIKLREAEAKKYGIEIDKFEVEREMEKLASQNNLTLSQFKEAIELRGMSWNKYQKIVKQKIENEKLDKKISISKLRNIDEAELKKYYENNLNEFAVAKNFEVIEYSSSSKDALEKSMKNPMLFLANVKKEAKKLNANSINPRLLFILNDSKESSFTPVLTTSESYITFFVVKKMDLDYLSFSEVKDVIFAKLIKEKEERIIKEHFEKLKAKADIKVIRLPS